MNPDFSPRLNNFAQQVILPGLDIIQQHCARQGHRAWVVTELPSEDTALNAFVEKISHLWRTHIFVDEAIKDGELLTEPTRWWMGALGLQLQSKSERLPAAGAAGGNFYLVIEGVVQTDAVLRGLPSVLYGAAQGLEHLCLTHPVAQPADEALRILQPADVLNTFIHYLEAFRAGALTVESVVKSSGAEPLSPEIKPMPTVDTERESITVVEPNPEPVAELISPPSPPVPESWGEQIRAARQKVEVAQRAEVEAFLSFLKLQQADFKLSWATDLERGSALSRKVMLKRPTTESEHQRAFDALVQQAIGFAWSLEPVALAEFANYFELYWTMAEEACAACQGEGTDADAADALIAQVAALGEPENIHQAKAEIAKQMRSVVYSIGLKFGRPDAMGCRNCLGFTTIPMVVPLEQMVSKIQGRSEQYLVRFEELSWGVLQVYQNAGSMPPSEQRLGRHVVLSFWRSARLTIEQPTEAVVCSSVDVEFFEFRFVRLIMEGGQSWRAVAVVRVSQVYGRLVLHLYRFEAL